MALLLVLSCCSLFVGVIDLTPGELLAGNFEQLEIFIISRLPRLLAILCTGIGMSVAGLIMQQLCSNKFVSPTTGATISSAQFGILLALLFMPASTLWSRAIFAFATAILGTWIFVWFIQRIQFKDVVMVPLVGIMFGNVIGGITNYLAYKYEMTQALSSWLVGHFSLVLKGRYEIVWLTVPLVVLAFLFANHFNIVGLGKDFSKNLGVPYNLVLFSGLTIAAMITASIVVVVGSISYIGLIVPNVVAMYKGDKIRGTLVDSELLSVNKKRHGRAKAHSMPSLPVSQHIEQSAEAVKAVADHIGVLLRPFFDLFLYCLRHQLCRNIPGRRNCHREISLFYVGANIRIQLNALL